FLYHGRQPSAFFLRNGGDGNSQPFGQRNYEEPLLFQLGADGVGIVTRNRNEEAGIERNRLQPTFLCSLFKCSASGYEHIPVKGSLFVDLFEKLRITVYSGKY